MYGIINTAVNDSWQVHRSGSDTAGPDAVRTFLREHKVSEETVERIVGVVIHVSFKGELRRSAAGGIPAPAAAAAGIGPLAAGMADGPREKGGAAGTAGAAGAAECSESSSVSFARELGCVQDADRLDAIGAIGIAREGLTAEEYGRGSKCSVNHFHEKLLKLKDIMKTAAGRKVAEGRHAFMQQYLCRLQNEINALD